MLNINVGDYVRTKYGIAKIIQDGNIILEENGNRTIYVDKNGIAWENQFAYYIWSNDIIKSGPNIIDLIEVGDYVNGEKIIEITEREKTPDMKKYFLTNRSVDYGVRLHEDELNSVIESIVTKECFESMEYKIER